MKKITLSGFKTLTGLTREFRASDFVFSDLFGLGILILTSGNIRSTLLQPLAL